MDFISTSEIKTILADEGKLEITYDQDTELFYAELYGALPILQASGSGESLELAIADLQIA